MIDVVVGPGKLAGKGVYAARDFKKGEKLMDYNLLKLTQADFDKLAPQERIFVHSFGGEMYLFPEPSRYTNHSANPNTFPDFTKMCDYAARPIKEGEMITTNATEEVRYELETFIETLEKEVVTNFIWEKGGYRNAIISYVVSKRKKTLNLKRIDGNWRIVNLITE